jgi:hypothetical protein
MLCPTCGAYNSERAPFCQLCLTKLEGSPDGSQAVPAVALATAVPAAVESPNPEHEWYVRRRRETAEALERGEPTRGGAYALAAFEGQLRNMRAIWWSASLYTLFAWLAGYRVAIHDWAAVGQGSGSAVIIQAALIGCVGIAAACVCAAWIGGQDAWRATLINSFFWTLPAVLLVAVMTLGGQIGLVGVTGLAAIAVLVTAVAPIGRGGLPVTAPRR